MVELEVETGDGDSLYSFFPSKVQAINVMEYIENHYQTLCSFNFGVQRSAEIKS